MVQRMSAIADDAPDELPGRPKLNRYLSAAVKLIIALTIATLITAPFFLRMDTSPDGRPVRAVVTTDDMAQHLAVMEQFDLTLRSGVLYPRWQSEFNGGYGLAWTNFYQPGFFYLTSFINAILNDWINTLFVISILSLAASGLALYALSRQFYSQWASAIAALFYMLVPYHLLEIYSRGAMPELQGFIFVPAALYFAYKLGVEGRPRQYAGLAVFYGLFLMTHFPVAYLLTYTLALYAVVWAYLARDIRIAVRVAVGMIIGLMGSAIYLIPAVLEMKYVREHFTAIFPYHNSYITLLPGDGRISALLNQSFAVQSLALIVAILVLTRVPRATDKSSEAEQMAADYASSRAPEIQTRLWIICGSVTTFMITSYSIYISKLIPKIEAVSFAWRWMVIAGAFTALLVGAAVDHLQRSFNLKPRALWLWRALVGAAVLLCIAVTVQSVVRGTLSNSSLKRRANHIEEAFVPKSAAGPNDLPDTQKVVIEPHGGSIEILKWEPQQREVHVKVDEQSRVRLKTYNFPGWVAKVDGNQVPILDDQDGAQVVEVSPGIHRIQASFINTPPRTAGTAVSALALVLILGLVVLDYVKRGPRAPRQSDSA